MVERFDSNIKGAMMGGEDGICSQVSIGWSFTSKKIAGWWLCV